MASLNETIQQESFEQIKKGQQLRIVNDNFSVEPCLHLETWSGGVRRESKFSKVVTILGSFSQTVNRGLLLPGTDENRKMAIFGQKK